MKLSLLILPFLVSITHAGSVTIVIQHLWEGNPLDLEEGEYITEAGENINITRLSYLLSEPELLEKGTNNTSGSWISHTGWFAFVDSSSKKTTLNMGELPAKQFTNLRFHIGLDPATDRSDPNQYPARHPLNPMVNNLHWSPQGGYIFLALEGHKKSNSDTSGFTYHLGNSSNRVTVNLPVDLDLAHDTSITLQFHVDRIFNTPPLLRIADQESTHSRKGDPLVSLLKKRASSCFSIANIQYTTPPIIKKPTRKPINTVGTPYRFRLAKGFPVPDLPTDYPLSNERVALGRVLFHDPALSRNGTISCASCHQQKHAFTDSKRFSEGVDKQIGKRNSMPLINLAWKKHFFWDGRSPTLREQALIPIEDHLEMDESLENVVKKISAEKHYAPLFKSAYGSAEITPEHIGIAIEQFLITLTSYDSRFDRAGKGSPTLTDQEKRGFELFMTEHDPRQGLKGADCFHCHGGAFFTDHQLHNNGLPPSGDIGLAAVTGKKSDREKFSTPSLRNIALTSPYMHDGRFKTLEEVVAHYNSGLHRSPTLDPNLAKHPHSGLGLSKKDQAALVAFLKTLTDPQFSSE